MIPEDAAPTGLGNGFLEGCSTKMPHLRCLAFPVRLGEWLSLRDAGETPALLQEQQHQNPHDNPVIAEEIEGVVLYVS